MLHTICILINGDIVTQHSTGSRIVKPKTRK